MLKRILAAAAAAVIAASMSGCSYTMTEEDLALQKSLVGYWAADNSTGYNEFDENGNLTMMTAVQFTDDFNYLLYYYYPNVTGDPNEPSYVVTNPPISYTIEDGKFRVESGGKASYAGISITDGGYVMNWITDEKTDLYLRFSASEAASFGFPAYDPEYWKNAETASDISGEDGSEDGSQDGNEEAGGEETGGEE